MAVSLRVQPMAQGAVAESLSNLKEILEAVAETVTKPNKARAGESNGERRGAGQRVRAGLVPQETHASKI